MIRCNLSVLLAEQNLKITKVAVDTGISRNTLHLLLSNRSQGIQFDTMNTLCLYLKVTPDELFSFCPFDVKIIGVGKTDDSPEYIISFEIKDYRKRRAWMLSGFLEKLDRDEETYLFKITFDMPDNKATDELREYFKLIPRSFKNDIEGSLLEKAFPDQNTDNFLIHWAFDHM